MKKLLSFLLIICILSVTGIAIGANANWQELWNQYGNMSNLDISTMEGQIVAGAIMNSSDQELSSMQGEDRNIALKLIEKIFAGSNEEATDTNGEAIRNSLKQIMDKYNKINKNGLTEEENEIADRIEGNGNILFDNENVQDLDEALASGDLSLNQLQQIVYGTTWKGQTITEEQRKKARELLNQKNDEINKMDDEMQNVVEGYLPDREIGLLNPTESDGKISVDNTIKGAEDFANEQPEKDPVDQQKMQEISNSLFNILLTIAVILAIIIGLIIGIKFIMSSAEDKANIKQALIPYVAGCVVAFGAFGIWKIVIEILNTFE